MSLLFSLVLLLSLGAVDFCSAQQNPFDLGSEDEGWEVDVGSGQFWLMDRNFPHHRLERSKSHRIPISLPEGGVLKPEEATTILEIIKDDFLVNDDTNEWVFPVLSCYRYGCIRQFCHLLGR